MDLMMAIKNVTRLGSGPGDVPEPEVVKLGQGKKSFPWGYGTLCMETST